jgi:SAM-dependent methyltransferase
VRFDYDAGGQQYAQIRRADPTIARRILDELGEARSVLNVGAGAGSYEPIDRYVVAVEPSVRMRSERIAEGRHPAIIASAETLPFDDAAFDAAMAIVTVHHWMHLEQGLLEMRRVTRGPVVVMTFDPDALDVFWNAEYFPELIDIERRRYPPIDRIAAALGRSIRVETIPIPVDCTDGFQEAFYGRPEAFLQPMVRRAQSAWGFLPEGAEQQLVSRLERALDSGEWERRHGHWRTTPWFHGALRLVISC